MWGGDKESDVRTWFADNGGAWPIIDDPNGSIAVSLGVAQVPETWIVSTETGSSSSASLTQITADAVVADGAALAEAESGVPTT